LPDTDHPYEFDRRPRADAPTPFQVREYARLLIMRGRVRDGLVARDDVGEAKLPLRWPVPVTRTPNPWCRCAACHGHVTPVAVQFGNTVLCLKCAQRGVTDDLTEAILYTAGTEES